MMHDNNEKQSVVENGGKSKFFFFLAKVFRILEVIKDIFNI